MRPDSWHTIAIVLFCLAAVLAVAAVILFFAPKIRIVYNRLSGKTAEREISSLRRARHALWRAEATDSSSRSGSRRSGTGSSGGNHSLIQMRVAKTGQSFPSPSLSDDEALTSIPDDNRDMGDESETVIGVPVRPADPDSEAGTVVRIQDPPLSDDTSDGTDGTEAAASE